MQESEIEMFPLSSFIILYPVLRISPYDLHKSIHGTISGVFGSFGKLISFFHQLGLDQFSANIPEIPLPSGNLT